MRYFCYTFFLLFLTYLLTAQTIEVNYYTPAPTQVGSQNISKAGTATLKALSNRSLFIEHAADDIVIDNLENQAFRASLGWTKDLWLYKDFKTKELIYKTPFSKRKYVKVEEEIVRIPWQLTDQQREIGGLPCQKAIGEFRGRTYHAWFTYTIPISDGPWKLTGLPGLIIEAYDDKKTVIFLFESLRRTHEPIIKPREKLKVTDYKTAYKKIVNTYKKVLKLKEAQMKKEGINLKIDFTKFMTREKIIP